MAATVTPRPRNFFSQGHLASHVNPIDEGAMPAARAARFSQAPIVAKCISGREKRQVLKVPECDRLLPLIAEIVATPLVTRLLHTTAVAASGRWYRFARTGVISGSLIWHALS